jgi:outer membrane protein assembly factor BamB
LQWGSATDGKRVYVASSNSEFKEWILKDGTSGGCRGGWSALDAATGSILWDFVSGANCNGGATIVDGMVFWGTGYDAFAASGGNAAQALYAFGLPKRGGREWQEQR